MGTAEVSKHPQPEVIIAPSGSTGFNRVSIHVHHTQDKVDHQNGKQLGSWLLNLPVEDRAVKPLLPRRYYIVAAENEQFLIRAQDQRQARKLVEQLEGVDTKGEVLQVISQDEAYQLICRNHKRPFDRAIIRFLHTDSIFTGVITACN